MEHGLHKKQNSNESLDGGLNLNIHMVNNLGHFSGVGGTISPAGDARKIPALHYNQNPKVSRFDTGANIVILSKSPKTVI
jgi:hypothetical protein